MSAALREQPVERVLPLLDAVRSTAPGRWISKCPGHADKSPSLSIREAEDGRVLVHCFAGCSVEEITESLGLSIRDLFPPRPSHERGKYAREGRIPAGDALRCLASESVILCLAAEQLGRGEPLNGEDRDRLSAAVSRIQFAAQVCS